jgi:hypothetical protein
VGTLLLGLHIRSPFTNQPFTERQITSPALTELEQVMLDWLVQMLALPEVFLSTSSTGGGVIQNTASDSVLCALLAAKYRTAEQHGLDAQQDATVAQRIVVYCSDQVRATPRLTRVTLVLNIATIHRASIFRRTHRSSAR